jgi:hypothetical protein
VLPLQAVGRGMGSRSLLRAADQGLLLHDASYWCCCQLEGPQEQLMQLLNAMRWERGLQLCVCVRDLALLSPCTAESERDHHSTLVYGWCCQEHCMESGVHESSHCAALL